MAYAAAACLKNTIERLLNYQDYISFVPPSRETIEAVRDEAKYLMALLRALDKTSKGRSRNRVNALDGDIREVVSKFEDVFDSHVTAQFLSQSDRNWNGDGGTQFCIDLMDLKQDIHSFTESVTELKEVYIRVLQNMYREDDDDDDDDDAVVSSVTDFAGKDSNMVGLSDTFHEAKALVLDESDSYRGFVCLLGMGGIGKTSLAKKVFDDPDVISHFKRRLWVTVGRNCRPEEILRVLIAQLNTGNDQILARGEEDMAEYLKERLLFRRFLIVVDDVWDEKVWSHLIYSSTPEDNNGSRVLLTSRLHREVERYLRIQVRFLNNEESWELLREKVFGKEPCSHRLEKVGKKIAEKCDGLPLTILAIAKLLSKAEMTPEYWNEVLEDRNSVFMDAYDEVLEVLYPSYDYLPQHLKMCFLSAGVFPRKTKIPRSKLINIWEIEGFLVTPTEEYVSELVLNSLFLQHEMSTTMRDIYYTRMIKTCGVHSSLWHLCNREARKTKSFHVLCSRKHGLSEDIKRQRRLCIHNNVLFAIKDVHKSMEDEHCSSTARSLECYGPYHPYQVPVTFGLRLLSLLDALTIRFYEFPVEVVKLVQLRYLALTSNGMLPTSISKLWQLQFLIVRQHLRVFKSSSFLPMTIWDMKELKHLRITGSDLPDPTPVDTLLPNLSTLLDVSDKTCTKGVLERIPSLEKLGLRIELRPDGDEPFSWLAHISCLENLDTLKCVIMNPARGTKIAPLPNFSSCMRKLTLSGLCYPWEELSKIASLPNLQVLKLRNYAFQGPVWHMENGFDGLTSLLIEDTDLVQWAVGRGCFSNFSSRISLKHCYKLQEIQWESFARPSVFQVIDCNPLLLPCWNKLNRRGASETFVHAHSSWEHGGTRQKFFDAMEW